MCCEYEHSVYDPDGEWWRCPNCGEDELHRTDHLPGACDRLHVEDVCRCENCGLQISGGVLALRKRRKWRLPCPVCGG